MFNQKSETTFFKQIHLNISQSLKHYLTMQQSKSSSIKKNTNTLVYISRVDARFTERDIMDIIYDANIGRVSYADITAVRDNSPDAGPEPEIKFYSAFVMMASWNPAAFDDFTKFGQIRVFVDKQQTSYWLLKHADKGSEIPRSKVNTHQLAHYTAELYKRMDASEKKTEEQIVLNEDTNIRLTYCTKDLYNRINAADIKIEEQARIIDDQNERMAHMLEMMEKMLSKNEELENKLASTQMTLSCMDAFMAARFPQDK
jgi:hypothetical protein